MSSTFAATKRVSRASDHLQVGIIHTSYRELSRRNAGIVMYGISTVFNSLLCAIHCHKASSPADPICSSRMDSFPGRISACAHKCTTLGTEQDLFALTRL